MKVLVTGADGFIGKNLCVRLGEQPDVEVLSFIRGSSPGELNDAVAKADVIFHLAGVNRPKDVSEFRRDNADLTSQLCEAVRASQRRVPVVYTSSIQAGSDTPYGRSKLEAEQALQRLSAETGTSVLLFRLPNVFGKWCRPNYNSAVATFCHNMARQLPIQINDPAAVITLVYIDDVVNAFLELLGMEFQPTCVFGQVHPQYATTVGKLVEQIAAFRNCRTSLMSERVGSGLTRALYATYVSYLPVGDFHYPVPKYGDPRGVFVEMLKTPDAGQFSFFTAHPGVTRGGHYHHSKTEKFLVIKGRAHFRFKHLITGEFHEVFTDEGNPEIVETVPGWTHDITNVGDSEMVVMLWANEVFDRARPDTVGRPIQ